MRKLIAILFLISFSATAQQKLINVGGWNCYVHVPYNYNPALKYPTIIFSPGLGEVGTNAAALIANGPGAYIAQGWNGNVKIGNDSVRFIVISLQPPSAWPGTSSIDSRIQTLKSLYSIDPKQLHLTGLSMGGWASMQYATGDNLGGPYYYASQVASVVSVEGVTSSDNSPWPDRFDNFSLNGGKMLNFEQINDYRKGDIAVARMNLKVPGSATYIQTNFSGGGHCCWNQFYGGQGTQPGNFINGENIYQWMARQTKTQQIKTDISNYYISNSGNDGNDGHSPATAWKTLAKVNATSFVSGDSIFFNRGDIFYGQLNRSFGLRNESPIVFTAYGSGNKPVITGLSTITGWTNKGGNIWESNNAVSNTNLVVINGKSAAMGRYPNTGWKTIQSSTSTSITDNTLQTEWTGGQIIAKVERPVIMKYDITSQFGSTLYFDAPAQNPKNGWGYFIQNHLKTLDIQDEWYYNSTTKKLSIYSAYSPLNVQVCSIDTLVTAVMTDDITFDNLAFSGSNIITMQIGSGVRNTIKNCDFNYAGTNAIWGRDFWKGFPGSDLVITGNTFKNTNNYAIYLEKEKSGAYIGNNTIDSTALLVGSMTPGDAQSCGIYAVADSLLIEKNSLLNSGYTAIYFGGNGTIIKNNYINNFNLRKDDGGGIYTWIDDISRAYRNMKIIDNVVLNGIGDVGGVTDGNNEIWTDGIYLDQLTSYVEIYGNTVANCARAGLFPYRGRENNFHNNTSYNNRYGIRFQDDLGTVRNVINTNNIYASKYGFLGNYSFPANNINTLGTVDSNHYLQSSLDSSIIMTMSNNWSTTDIFTLDQWQKKYGYDLHSSLQFADTSKIKFLYAVNNTFNTYLDGTYSDLFGNSYSGNIDIKPYTSMVLIRQIPAPPTHKKILVGPGGDGGIYFLNNNNQVQAGDTISVQAGEYPYMTFKNLHGTVKDTIIIINSGGQVIVNGSKGTGACYNIQQSDHFRFTGTGDSRYFYGFLAHWTGGKTGSSTVGYQTSNYRVDHFEAYNVENGWLSKINPDNDDFTTWRGGWTVKNVKYDNNYIHLTKGEGVYFMNTDMQTAVKVNGKDTLVQPVAADTVEFCYNITDSTGWDGLQFASCTNANIHDNTVTNYGLQNMSSQQAGIIFGGRCTGDVYNNLVRKGTGNGMQIAGYGLIKVYQNILDSCGWDGSAQRQDALIINDNPFPGLQYAGESVYVFNNTIVNAGRGAIWVPNSYNSMSAGKIYNNLLIAPAGNNNANHFIESNISLDLKSNIQIANYSDGKLSGYKLSSASPGVSAGMNLSQYFTTDFNGTDWEGIYNAGVYKFKVSGPLPVIITKFYISQ